MRKWTLRAPDNFIPERRYVSDYVLSEYFGLQYEYILDRSLSDTYILTSDHNEIIFTDAFFAGKDERVGYLDKENIPSEVKFVQNKFTPENDIPLIFGTDDCRVEQQKIYCGNDLFASIFFMLSRWEEAVINQLDYLERFPAHESLAVKGCFLHRPVVNEWLQMLRNMLLHLEPSITFNQKSKFEIVFTHDIDLLNKPVSVREFAKDVLKRRSIHALLTRFGYGIGKQNPYDLFDYFMDISESQGTVSRFYFMTGHNIPYKDGEDYNRSEVYKTGLKKIRERGHVIGFHPSLLTYNNAEMFRQEKEQLERDCGMKVTEGRQHALRFKMPDTWRIWNDNGMEVDSTLGYSAQEGFRCGTGDTFPTFDVHGRKPLKLKEMPLVVMDTTIHVNRRLSVEESEKTFNHYIATGKKYNMPVTFLFHNLIHERIDWPQWKHLYEKMFSS